MISGFAGITGGGGGGLDGGVAGLATWAPGIDAAPKPELIGGMIVEEDDVAVPPEVTVEEKAGFAACPDETSGGDAGLAT